MFKTLLSVVLIIFSPSMASANVPTCDEVLEGLKQPWRTPLDLYARSLRLLTMKKDFYIPADGIGRLIRVEDRLAGNARTSIRRVISRFPEYMARVDIYQSSEAVLIPDGPRLTHLVKNGIRFADYPNYFKEQFYDEEYFGTSILKRTVPLGSEDYAFVHDRLQEHMLGAIIMPSWLFDRFARFVQFERAWLQSMGWSRTKFLDEQYNYRPGAVWDDLTSDLGKFMLNGLERDPDSKQIKSLAEILFNYSDRINPKASHSLDTAVMRWASLSPDYESVMNKFKMFKLEYGLEHIEKQFAIDEAVRIIHEITGKSIEELKAKAPKDLT